MVRVRAETSASYSVHRTETVAAPGKAQASITPDSARVWFAHRFEAGTPTYTRPVLPTEKQTKAPWTGVVVCEVVGVDVDDVVADVVWEVLPDDVAVTVTEVVPVEVPVVVGE